MPPPARAGYEPRSGHTSEGTAIRGTSAGAATASTWESIFCCRPWAPAVDRAVLQAWEQAPVLMSRPGGGLAPGGSWRRDGVSWTNVTGSRAMTAAFLGERDEALARLRWLDQHRTAAGSLPEKVLSNGQPAAVSPLAWTAAIVRDHGGSAGVVAPSGSAQSDGELEGTIRAERAKRAEQSNWSSQAERVVEAGVSGGQNSAADDPRRTLLDGDDLGLGKCRDRQPAGDSLVDRCHQMRAQAPR